MAETLMLAAVAVAAVNVLLLAVVAGIWVRNYREFKSDLVLGLLAFALVLLVENLVAIYFSLHGMHMLYAADPLVAWVVLAMRSLEFLAVAVLTWVTVQ